jgi:hypothetical protein
MFSTGKWLTTFWVVLFILLLTHPSEKLTLEPVFKMLIIGFFAMIPIVGYFKGSYHKYWYDSANRMYIHILPLMVLYVLLKLSLILNEHSNTRKVKPQETA